MEETTRSRPALCSKLASIKTLQTDETYPKSTQMCAPIKQFTRFFSTLIPIIKTPRVKINWNQTANKSLEAKRKIPKPASGALNPQWSTKTRRNPRFDAAGKGPKARQGAVLRCVQQRSLRVAETLPGSTKRIRDPPRGSGVHQEPRDHTPYRLNKLCVAKTVANNFKSR